MQNIWKKYPNEKPVSDKAIYIWSAQKQPENLTRLDYYTEYGEGEYSDIDYWCYEQDLIKTIGE